MSNQLVFGGILESTFSLKTKVNFFKAREIAMILVAFALLQRIEPSRYLGSGSVKEMIRVLFSERFTNWKGLSPAITKICLEPNNIEPCLLAEAEALMPELEIKANEALERAKSKEGASHE